MTPTEVCKLCLRQAVLRNSHILPEFAFRPLYDETHGAVEHTVNTGASRIIRKGYRERMLCDACEGQFSALESYFAEHWINRSLLPSVIPSDSHLVHGLDYARFKLFHLSVLWRAGVSSHDAFRLIRLGPYEEQLRSRLLAQDAGPPHTFAVSATLLVDPHHRAPARGIFLEPERRRIQNRFFCIFTFAACGWYYAVGNTIPRELADGVLEADGSMLLDVAPYTEYTPLTRTFGRLQKARRALHKS